MLYITKLHLDTKTQLLGKKSLFCFHEPSFLFRYNSFFRMGTVAFNESIRYVTASRAAARWGEATPIITDVSHTGTVPILWYTRIVCKLLHFNLAFSQIFCISLTAIGSYALYSNLVAILSSK